LGPSFKTSPKVVGTAGGEGVEVSVAVAVLLVRVVRVEVRVVVAGFTMTVVMARVMTVSVVDWTVVDKVSRMTEVRAAAYSVTAVGSRQAQADEYWSLLGQSDARGNKADEEVVVVVVEVLGLQ
jgi:hypothetical protein